MYGKQEKNLKRKDIWINQCVFRFGKKLHKRIRWNKFNVLTGRKKWSDRFEKESFSGWRGRKVMFHWIFGKNNKFYYYHWLFYDEKKIILIIIQH